MERLDRLSRPLDAARVREKLGLVLHAAGRLTQALEALEQASAILLLAEGVQGPGRVVARIGHIHGHRGTLEEGVARLRPQLEVLAANGPSHSLAVLAEALAYLYMQGGQFDGALAVATRSAEAARALPDTGLLAWAEVRRGAILSNMGRTEEALSALQEARVLAEAVGDLNVLCRAYQYVALIAEDRGEFDRAGHNASRMLAVGEQLGDAVQIRLALFRLAAQAFFTGAWGDAHAYMERVQELPDRSPSHDAYALIELGRLAMAEGAWEQASRYLEQCGALLPHGGDRNVHSTAGCLLAEREVLEGRPRAAVARLLPLLDGDGKQERAVTIYVLPVLAWAYLELGDLDQAARTIGEALRRQRAEHYHFGMVDALRVQALVAMRQGDLAAAERALEEGLTLARALPYPHGEGRLLEVYGRLRLECAQITAARERLEAALAIFQRLGAHKDIEQVEQLLTALG